MTQLSRSDNEWGKDERSARCRVDNRPQGYGGNLSHFTAYLQPYKEGGKLWTLHIQKKILFRIHSTLQLAKNTLSILHRTRSIPLDDTTITTRVRHVLARCQPRLSDFMHCKIGQRHSSESKEDGRQDEGLKTAPSNQARENPLRWLP